MGKTFKRKIKIRGKLSKNIELVKQPLLPSPENERSQHLGLPPPNFGEVSSESKTKIFSEPPAILANFKADKPSTQTITTSTSITGLKTAEMVDKSTYVVENDFKILESMNQEAQNPEPQDEQTSSKTSDENSSDSFDRKEAEFRFRRGQSPESVYSPITNSSTYRSLMYFGMGRAGVTNFKTTDEMISNGSFENSAGKIYNPKSVGRGRGFDKRRGHFGHSMDHIGLDELPGGLKLEGLSLHPSTSPTRDFSPIRDQFRDLSTESFDNNQDLWSRKAVVNGLSTSESGEMQA